MPTNDNPADIASRGMTKGLATKIQIWLKAPAFLWESEEKWPKKRINEADEEIWRQNE